MASITTRAGKGSPLTNAEVDANFTNLNTELGQKLVASNLTPYLTSATAASTYQPLDADLTSIAGLAGTSGFLKKTAANTWELDTNTYLTGNQSITFTGDATGSGATSVALTLANSGVTAGAYGSSTSVPVVTVDAKGRVTSITTSAISGSLTFTGDVTGTGSTGSSTALTLANSGVTAGTYRSITVDAKGRATAGTNPTTLAGYGITDAQALDADLTAIAALAGTSGFLKKTAANTWTLDTSTYLTGITSGQVTTALGFTPYNSTNPSGYITSSGSISGSAGSVSGLTLTSSANGINPDSVTQNQIGYNTSVSLFGQTDGGLYSSAYNSSWIHQIYGDFRTGQIAIRGKNSGTWQAWRTVLDSSNYTSYAVRQDYNTSLNSDSRNTRGVTRLYRNDDNSDYNVQIYWTGSYWYMKGYNGDSYHAGVQVAYADSAGSAPANGGTSSAVTINYNNDSNSTYQMLWGSGNSVYGTGGIYCNPYTDYLYSGSFYCGNWFRSSGNTGWYNESYAGGWYMTDTTWVRTYNSKSIYTDGQIAAAGAVTGYYSDERLKTKVAGIENALDKIEQLSGFLYVENDLARSFGYNNPKPQVALSAQDVKRVQPEAVSLAPFDMETKEDGTIVSKSGEEYLTVDYARLVPLLVEGIKELRAEVKAIKNVCVGD